jgi:hypothetical protein
MEYLKTILKKPETDTIRESASLIIEIVTN